MKSDLKMVNDIKNNLNEAITALYAEYFTSQRV